MRPVVPARRAAGGVRAGAPPGPVAGADDGDRLFAVAVGGADPVPQGGGPVRGVVAADQRPGGGAAGAGLGRGGRDRPVAGRAGPSSPAECQAFRGTLAAKVVVCKPADPEAKGLVERAHDYLERSFLPGRSFDGPADFNAQLGAWIAVVNTRGRRALGCAPGRPDRRRQAGDAGAAAGRAGDRVAVLGAAGPRPLRPAGLQRLLRPPGGDRPPGRGDRGPGPGPGALRRAGGRRPRAGLGLAPDHHRPGASRGGRRRCAASAPGSCARSAEPQVEQRSLAVYDAVLGTGADGGAA